MKIKHSIDFESELLKNWRFPLRASNFICAPEGRKSLVNFLFLVV
jgi:hypothetical protein